MPFAVVIVGLVIIVGAVALTVFKGDETVSTDQDQAVVEESTTTGSAITPPEQQGPELSYKDGTYNTEVVYFVPGNFEEPLRASLTLENDIITAAEVEFDGNIGTSRLHQGKFQAAYQAEVVGQYIDDLDLVRVGGASLATAAFLEAVANVQAEAAN